MEESLEAQLNKELGDMRETAGKMLMDVLPKSNAPLIMAISGAKGSLINLSQMIACVGQ